MFHKNQQRRAQAKRHALAIREDRRRGGRLSDPTAAASALFGIGFKLTEKNGSATLAYGAVDAAALQSFIRDYYFPFMAAEKYITRALLSAKIKLRMCKSIAKLAPRNKKQAVEELCQYRAAVETGRKRYSFVGLRPANLDHAKVAYPITGDLRHGAYLTVAGSAPLYTDKAFDEQLAQDRKRINVHRNRVDVTDVEDYTRGKRIARGSITCGK